MAGPQLAREMRQAFTQALKDATKDIEVEPPLKKAAESVEADGEKIERRNRSLLSSFTSLFGGAVRGSASLVAGLLSSGAKLVSFGAAAGAAVAGGAALIGVLGGLGTVAAQAAASVGLVPAALLGIVALTSTIKLGVQGVGDAFSALAKGDSKALAEALKELAPSARAFVREIEQVKPAFDKIQQGTQQRLFAGLADQVAPLADRYLPVLRNMFFDIAEAVNLAGLQTANYLQQASTVGQVTSLTGNLAAAIQRLAPALQPAVAGFLGLSEVGSRFLPALSSGVEGLAQRFANFVQQGQADGSLAATFQQALITIKLLGQGLGDFAAGLGNVFSIANQAGGGFLNTLTTLGAQFRAFTESAAGSTALAGFFSSAQAVLGAILPLVTSLATTVGSTLAPLLANLATTIGPALQPVIDALGPALAAAAPGIQALAQGFASFLQAAAPLLPVIGKIAGAIGGALGKVFEALAPVIERVAAVLESSLATILPQLEPVIGQVATALGQVLTSLVPLIPAFLSLLPALLPLLPALLNLVVDILPPLVGLITNLVPIITLFANILTSLIGPITIVAELILGILIPPINLILDTIELVAIGVNESLLYISNAFSAILGPLVDIVNGIWEGIVNVFRGALEIVTSFVLGGFNEIRSKVSSLMEAVRSVVGEKLQAVIAFFKALPGEVLGFLQGLASDAFHAGKNIVQGIINGITSLGSAIKDKIMSFVSGAWDAVKSFFGIASPSKLADQTFQDVIRGAVRGIDKRGPDLLEAMSSLARESMVALTPDLPAGGPLVGGVDTVGAPGFATPGGLVVNQTNVMTPGADVAVFSSTVSTKLAQRLSSGRTTLPVSQGPVQAGMSGPERVWGVFA